MAKLYLEKKFDGSNFTPPAGGGVKKKMKIIMSPPPHSSRENLANRAQYLLVKLKKILHLVLKIHTKARNEPRLSINTRQWDKKTTICRSVFLKTEKSVCIAINMALWEQKN